jgi:hypothetical protein
MDSFSLFFAAYFSCYGLSVFSTDFLGAICMPCHILKCVKTPRQLLSVIKRNGEICTLQIEANGQLYASQGSSAFLLKLGQWGRCAVANIANPLFSSWRRNHAELWYS